MPLNTKPFSEQYKTNCMAIWYAHGRLNNLKKMAEEIVPKDEFGNIPSEYTLRHWRVEMSWDVWADEMDARAFTEVEDALVANRVMMLKEQASRGRELQVMGLEYLRDNKFDTSASAVTAVIRGAEMERVSRGISERIEKLSKMGDDELTKEAMKLLSKAKESGEILDLPSLENIEEDDLDDAET